MDIVETFELTLRPRTEEAKCNQVQIVFEYATQIGVGVGKSELVLPAACNQPIATETNLR